MSPSSGWEPPFHLSLNAGTFLEALNADHPPQARPLHRLNMALSAVTWGRSRGACRLANIYLIFSDGLPVGILPAPGLVSAGSYLKKSPRLWKPTEENFPWEPPELRVELCH